MTDFASQLLTQFQIGVTLLYCFWTTPPSLWKDSYRSSDVFDAMRACSSTLAILAERWAEAECCRDVFEVLAREVPVGETWRRPKRLSEAGRKSIEQNWRLLQEIVIHRPTLRMIHEMAAEDFPAEPAPVAGTAGQQQGVTGNEMDMYNQLDLHWIDPSHGPIGDLETDLSHGAATGLYQANFDLGYG